MSNYMTEWNAAKNKFEATTGLDKPTMKGKLLFVAYRKQTGIESAFKDFDKINPTGNLDLVTPKEFTKIREACDELVKKSNGYIDTLEDAIKKEKADQGKTDQYRELKILKQKLLETCGKAEGDIEKISASMETKAKGLQRQGLSVLTVIKGLAAGIKTSSAQCIGVMQLLLKDPTPANFNDRKVEINRASRNLTQNLSNLLKWGFPDDLNPRSADSRQRLLEAEPKVMGAVFDLQNKMAHVRDRLLPLVAQAGNTPITADLAVYANDTPQFATTATTDDVKAAIKHYLGMIKEAMAIGEQLK